MANRVLIGNRSDIGTGLFVSKIGDDVLTVDEDDLLYSSNRRALQFVQVGTITILQSAPVLISIPDLGFNPIILFYNKAGYQSDGGYYIANELTIVVRYPSSSSASLHIAPYSSGLDSDLSASGTATSYDTVYAITNLPTDV